MRKRNKAPYPPDQFSAVPPLYVGEQKKPAFPKGAQVLWDIVSVWSESNGESGLIAHCSPMCAGRRGGCASPRAPWTHRRRFTCASSRGFDIRARLRADGLEHRAIFTDDDALVRRPARSRWSRRSRSGRRLIFFRPSISTPMPWGTSSLRCSSAFSRISSAQMKRSGWSVRVSSGK